MTLSSDHAGIAQELQRLERQLYRVLAHVDDPRDVRDYLQFMVRSSTGWLETHQAIVGDK